MDTCPIFPFGHLAIGLKLWIESKRGGPVAMLSTLVYVSSGLFECHFFWSLITLLDPFRNVYFPIARFIFFGAFALIISLQWFAGWHISLHGHVSLVREEKEKLLQQRWHSGTHDGKISARQCKFSPCVSFILATFKLVPKFELFIQFNAIRMVFFDRIGLIPSSRVVNNFKWKNSWFLDGIGCSWFCPLIQLILITSTSLYFNHN